MQDCVELQKIDLHLHLCGSLQESTVNKLAAKNLKFLKDNEKELYEEGKLFSCMIPRHTNTHCEYLEYSKLACKLLQTPESIEIAFEDLANTLANHNLRYAEIRFAPQCHSTRAVSSIEREELEDEIVKAAIRGINKVTSKREIVINIILCCIRNIGNGIKGRKDNMRTVGLAKKYLNNGVCAIDLAGPEARNATRDFAEIFHMAKNENIPFTIHAGEAGSIEWVLDSLACAIQFGATRIGHGVGIRYDYYKLFKVAMEKGITFEWCLTSNINTKTVNSLESCPFLKFYNDGIRGTINTDNMTVNNTSLDSEYAKFRQIGFTDYDIIKTQKYAFEAAFMTDVQKKKLEVYFK